MAAVQDNKWLGHVHVVPIKDIKVGKRHRKDIGDIDALAASIEQVSLLHPRSASGGLTDG